MGDHCGTTIEASDLPMISGEGWRYCSIHKIWYVNDGAFSKPMLPCPAGRAYQAGAAAERVACAAIASPYHCPPDGCGSLCSICKERRAIRDKIRARGGSPRKGS